MTRNRSIRRGITLIELMVAMAITLVIMLVLGEGFKGTLDFVRGANSVGGMIYQLNGAGTIMTRDLTKAEHFTPEDYKPNRGVLLSDQRLDWFNSALPNRKWTPPRGGFFRIVSPQPQPDGNDQEGFKITWAENHLLHFTSVLPGGSDQNLYTVRVGNNTFSSRAAEVAYFLSPTTGTTGPGGARQVNLHNLIRRYRLVAMDDEVANFPATINAPDDEVLSRNTATGGINTLATVALPANRMPLTPLAGNRFGEDILLSNVLSAEVLVDWTPHPSLAGSTNPPTPFSSGNTDAPWDFLTQGGNVFDTGATPVPQYVRVKSLRVVLRVWDPRMKLARQNTWYFYM